MRHKLRLLNLVLIVVFIFSFTACNTPKAVTETTTTQTETTVTKTTAPVTTATETTVIVTETTIDESKDYIGKIVVIGLKMSESLVTWGQSCLDVGNGKISISENKKDTSNYIKDINDCYDIYLSLKVPEKFNTPHELMGKAIDHFINVATYLQQYIDTENISDMTGYLGQANSEIIIGNEYLTKATEQYSSLAPATTVPETTAVTTLTAAPTTVPETTAAPTTTIVETTVPETTAPETTAPDSATLSEKNAAKKALDYLAYTSFSYSGLVGQLEYEGYTHEEAVYGVDRCGADWNKQAALKAKQYLDYTSFSRDGLIAQLEYEGFTPQQAEYGVQAVGY